MLSRLANQVFNLQIVSFNFFKFEESAKSLWFSGITSVQSAFDETHSLYYGHIIHNLAIKTGNRILSTNK